MTPQEVCAKDDHEDRPQLGQLRPNTPGHDVKRIQQEQDSNDDDQEGQNCSADAAL